MLATSNYKHFTNFVAITSGFLYTYLIMFTPQMFLESLWSCAPPPIVVSFLQWGVNFIKYVQRNPEVSSIKSFVGIQLQRNWLNACNLRFASNTCLSYNARYRKQERSILLVLVDRKAAPESCWPHFAKLVGASWREILYHITNSISCSLFSKSRPF